MARTAKITLDGIEYQIRAFNIGELETIQKSGSDAWVVLKVALKRADPKIADPDSIEPTPTELEMAFNTIMTLAGLKKVEASPTPGTEVPPATA